MDPQLLKKRAEEARTQDEFWKDFGIARRLFISIDRAALCDMMCMNKEAGFRWRQLIYFAERCL